MGNKYDQPPVVEALCEFQFDPKSPWDLTIPGLIYEKIKGEFPEKGSHEITGLEISTKPGAITQNVERTRLVQFRHKSKPFLIQVGQHILTANHIAPYSSWQDFLPTIANALELYKGIANPLGLRRIGVRYINRVDIDTAQFKFSDFQFRPEFWRPSPNPKNIKSFIVGAEIPYMDGRDVMRIQLATAQSTEPGTRGFILDIDYFIIQLEKLKFEKAIEWVNNAHAQVENAFENSITDKLREQFREVKEA